ncbi:hypothetical protein HDE68_001060 [Pedobacter cryoconitis]|uniref:Uncharacterized protein n=1 Tax=Pedobacter cryoconitis TaxID=188932 RepID=A0A7W8ZJV0_9SPHI|nr:hypothetical protein [Pedobacter cryoconitis]MBB5635175.1 hypothetical protein [Pedobacter cryoconitis]
MPLIEQIQELMLEAGDIFTKSLGDRKLKISQFLQTQDLIRVYVNASSGLGHQATTIGILYRLIALGYNTQGKTAQIIYDNSDGATAAKLQLLIPGFSAADPQPLTFNNVRFEFITLADFPASAPALISFGVTGGFDDNVANLATRCNVEFFLKLQPFQWTMQNAIQRKDSADYIILETIVALDTAAFVNQGYYIPPPAMGETQYGWFEAAAPAKVTPYRQIIAACTGEESINLMPVYGIGNKPLEGIPQSNYVIEAMPDVRSATALFYLVAAVADRQTKPALPALNKAAVIVNIATNTPECYAEFAELISGAKDGSQGLNDYVNTNNLTTGTPQSRIYIKSFDSGDLQATLEFLQEPGNATKILIIKMNGLPLYAFDYMYAQSSLPPVFEGKGTANLVLNLNKPFINLVKDRTRAPSVAVPRWRNVVYPTLPLNAAPGQIAQDIQNQKIFRMKEGIATFNGQVVANFDTTSVFALATLIEQSYTADSVTNTYFTNLYGFYHDENNDKLLLSLCYFLSYVNGLEP